MSKPRTYAWTPLFGSYGDHRYFEDANTGRIALADDSGRFPEYTDDGVLFVDTARPVTVEGQYFHIPLVDEAGVRRSTIAFGPEALRLADITGQEIATKGGLVFTVTQKETR